MFADDLIIFGEATPQQATRTLQIIAGFCDVSGQLVGHDKSRVWFSKSTRPADQQCVLSIFNAQIGDTSHVYLGLPVLASRPAHFTHLVNKIQGKLQSWTAKTLSQAGKVVLIKSVIEPMIVYAVAGGPLPASIISKINKLIRSFFWESGGKNRMHVIAWEKIVQPKCLGGLGLRDVSVINGAMMMKILWKLANKENDDKP